MSFGVLARTRSTRGPDRPGPDEPRCGPGGGAPVAGRAARGWPPVRAAEPVRGTPGRGALGRRPTPDDDERCWGMPSILPGGTANPGDPGRARALSPSDAATDDDARAGGRSPPSPGVVG